MKKVYTKDDDVNDTYKKEAFRMQKFNDLYHPITATPFKNDSTYVEIMPCQSLKPYIKCFWGTKKPITKHTK